MPNGIVFALAQTNFQDMLGLMSFVLKPSSQSNRQLRINQKAHRLGVGEHGIVDLLRGEFKTGTNIFGFEKLVVFQNLSLWNSCSQQIKHIFHPDAVMANARPSAALLRVKCDAIRVFHANYHRTPIYPQVKIQSSRNSSACQGTSCIPCVRIRLNFVRARAS